MGNKGAKKSSSTELTPKRMCWLFFFRFNVP